MTVLPDQPATTAGQATNPLTDAVIRAAVDNAIHEARRTGTSPQAVIGSAPPVAQPGRPAMSQRATDATAMMIGGGFLSLCLGGAASLVLWSSGHADQTVIAWLCIGPPASFVTLKGLIKAFKTAAVPDVHNHVHTGPEYHETHTTNTKAIWHKNINPK